MRDITTASRYWPAYFTCTVIAAGVGAGSGAAAGSAGAATLNAAGYDGYANNKAATQALAVGSIMSCIGGAVAAAFAIIKSEQRIQPKPHVTLLEEDAERESAKLQSDSPTLYSPCSSYASV